ncbi:hypothetical protein OIV83_006125 [Microbotryomycetes sp. JL201]|nr:hypothetical protein OIV83_006125 [Microbotryomycetes sp. JL201]
MFSKEPIQTLLEACDKHAELTNAVERLRPVLQAMNDKNSTSSSIDVAKPVALESDILLLLGAKMTETTAFLKHMLQQSLASLTELYGADQNAAEPRRTTEQIIRSVLQAVKMYLDGGDSGAPITEQDRTAVGNTLFESVSALLKAGEVAAFVKRKALDVLDYGITHHSKNKQLLLREEVLGMKELGRLICEAEDFGVTERAIELAFRCRDVLSKSRTESSRAKLKAADTDLWTAAKSDGLRTILQDIWSTAKTADFDPTSHQICDSLSRSDPKHFKTFTATHVELCSSGKPFSAEGEAPVALNRHTLAIIMTRYSGNEDEDCLEQVLEIGLLDIASISFARDNASIVVNCKRPPMLDAVEVAERDCETVEIRLQLSPDDRQALVDVLKARKMDDLIATADPNSRIAQSTPPRTTEPSRRIVDKPQTIPHEPQAEPPQKRKSSSDNSSDLDVFFAKPTAAKKRQAAVVVVPVPASRAVRVAPGKKMTSLAPAPPDIAPVKPSTKSSSGRAKRQNDARSVKPVKRALRSFPTEVDVLNNQCRPTSPKSNRPSDLKARFDLPGDDGSVGEEHRSSMSASSPAPTMMSQSPARPRMSAVERLKQRAPLSQSFSQALLPRGAAQKKVFTNEIGSEQASDDSVASTCDENVEQAVVPHRQHLVQRKSQTGRQPLQDLDLSANQVCSKSQSLKTKTLLLDRFTNFSARDSGVGLTIEDGLDERAVSDSEESETMLRSKLIKMAKNQSPTAFKRMILNLTAETIEEGGAAVLYNEMEGLSAPRAPVEQVEKARQKVPARAQLHLNPIDEDLASIKRKVASRRSPLFDPLEQRPAQAFVDTLRKRKLSTTASTAPRSGKRIRTSKVRSGTERGLGTEQHDVMDVNLGVPDSMEGQTSTERLFDSLVRVSKEIALKHESRAEARIKKVERGKRNVLRVAHKMARQLERRSFSWTTLKKFLIELARCETDKARQGQLECDNKWTKGKHLYRPR